MPVQTSCPACQAEYTIPDEFRERRVKCKGCQEMFVASEGAGQPIPRAGISRELGPPAPTYDERSPSRRDSDPPRREERDRPRNRRRWDEEAPPKKGSSTGLIVGLVCGGFFLLVICGGVIGLISSRRSNNFNAVRGPGGRPMSVLSLVGGTVQVQGNLFGNDWRDPRQINAPSKAYSVWMEANKTYKILLKSTQFDAFLRLESPEGTELARDDDGGGNRNALITYRCSRAGQYVIFASALGGATGAFDLSVDDSAVPVPVPVPGPGTQPLPLVGGAGRVAGRIDQVSPRDQGRKNALSRFYEVRFEAGNTYRIDLRSQDFDAHLTLVALNGVRNDNDDFEGLNSRIVYPCTQSGTYRLIASSLGGLSAGAFDLEVQIQNIGGALLPKPKFGPKQKLLPNAITLVAGRSSIKSQLTFTDGRDPQRPESCCKLYTVPCEEGKWYRFDHRSKVYDAYLRLEGPTGTAIAADDDSGGGRDSRIVFCCKQTGHHRLFVSPLFNDSGAFELEAREEPPATTLELVDKTVSVPGRLVLAGPQEPVRRLPCRIYAIELKNGKNYRIEHRSRDYRPYLRLENAEGRELSSTQGGQNVVRVNFTCARDGVHRLYVSGAGGEIGAFDLEVTEQ